MNLSFMRIKATAVLRLAQQRERDSQPPPVNTQLVSGTVARALTKRAITLDYGPHTIAVGGGSIATAHPCESIYMCLRCCSQPEGSFSLEIRQR